MSLLLKIELINIDKLKPNSYNPNFMVESIRNHLKKEYLRVGYLQPILVRPKGDSYEIIDGFHRMITAKDVGLTELECVVVEMTDQTAKLTTLNLNKIKGENDPIRLAELLKDLKTSLDVEKLAEILDMSENEIESFDMLLSLPDSDGLNDNLNELETKTFNFTITGKENIELVDSVFNGVKDPDIKFFDIIAKFRESG